MRTTETIDPMWDGDARPGPAGRALSLAFGVSAGAARRLFPHLFRWARGRHPDLVLAWGGREYRVSRGGLQGRQRTGPGWEDNPRANFNESFGRSQALASARDESAALRAQLEQAIADLEAAQRELDEHAHSNEEPLDLSPEALAAAVQRTMGIGEEPDPGDVPRDPDALKERLEGMRAVLQALDDVKDFDLVEAVDDELYQLHKAVEYKLKNHRASEAKARLDSLFK
jgi:hypothetical protein